MFFFFVRIRNWHCAFYKCKVKTWKKLRFFRKHFIELSISNNMITIPISIIIVMNTKTSQRDQLEPFTIPQVLQLSEPKLLRQHTLSLISLSFQSLFHRIFSSSLFHPSTRPPSNTAPTNIYSSTLLQPFTLFSSHHSPTSFISSSLLRRV